MTTGASDDKARVKQAARSAALKRRRAAHAAEPDAPARLASHGIPLLAAMPGRVVSGYLPIRDELSVVPLLTAIVEAGRTAGLPVIEQKWAPLVFRRWAPGDSLVDVAFGLKEPLPTSPAVLPDILLVPLAAFDRRGYRIGYGGGYYDRTLALYRKTRQVVAIGIAYDAQEVEQVPDEPHDQPLDMILTPSGVFGQGASRS
ncbi:MAG: 5-formyltetrahydrofolate cyclo-ligase [Hyphomicrobiaceae bacterium]